MPSQFEPCGLSQMIAMRYGSIPLVRETGGLRDSVLPYNWYTDDGNGFSFHDYNAHDMLHVLEHAVGYWYDDRDMWARLMKRAMRTDFSWASSARKYMELYRNLLGLPEEPVKPVRKRTVRAEKPTQPKPAAKTAAKTSASKPAAKKPAAPKTKKSE
jgi:starch synthase